MAVLCDACWNEVANNLAEYEGATAPPRAESDPDDVTWLEPPVCPDCQKPVRHYPTNYDRWVYLAMGELPAKDVPAQYRWQLVEVRPRHSQTIIDIVAVRYGSIDPLPSDPVIPSHRMVCTAPESMA